MEVVADVGAHIIQGYSFLGVSIGWVVSLYRLPNVRYQRACIPIKPPAALCRAFAGDLYRGNCDGRTGREAGHRSARAALKNYVGLGHTFWGQGPMVRSIVWSDGRPRQLLGKGAEAAAMICNRPGEKRALPARHWAGRGFHTSSAVRRSPTRGRDRLFRGAGQGQPRWLGGRRFGSRRPRRHAGSHRQRSLCVPLDKVNVVPTDTFNTVYECVHARHPGSTPAAVRRSKWPMRSSRRSSKPPAERDAGCAEAQNG